jgi:anti-sigma regulatory factor (Ser/Thr protein kinase)
MTIAVPAPAVRSYRLTAPNSVDTPRLARNHVAELLRHTGHPELAETARLLVSETVTNVYLHTAVSQLTVVTTVRVDRVLVAVTDESPRSVPERRELGDGEEESGRGLALLGMLAAASGVTVHEVSKSIWFELREQEAGGGDPRGLG